NVILSILQCFKYVERENNEKIDEYNNLIKRNTLKMIKLINNLIDTTKLEGNYYKLNKRRVDIISFIENIATSIEKYAEVKNIQLIFDTNVEECIVTVDTECIDRIVMNLLSNAIKFTKYEGEVLLYVYVDKENIKISVKDNGIGIPEDEQKTIFNRFIQSSLNNKSLGSGSGIGLDLVNYLAKMHGGHIDLISEVNKGSEFIVTIPRCNDECSGENIELIKKNKVEMLEIEFSDIYL
ncbi:MAG: HAMP domain-containing histidine kinase, partial [Clostridiales bacterium]|nr:HAMP domain-containing histidine kinase [Clostridiales bacterium]